MAAEVLLMKPIEPAGMHVGARRVVYPGRKPSVIDLPAAVDDTGLVLTEWELGAEDLARLLRGGTIRLWLHTHGKPLQPVALETTEPEL
jgi:hypothetical protein